MTIMTTKEEKKDEPHTIIATAYLYGHSSQYYTVGFNVSKRKFSAFVNHTLATNPLYEWMSSLIPRTLSTKNIVVDSMRLVTNCETCGNKDALLTDRTEILAIYKSDDETRMMVAVLTPKRGGFSDLLHIYANRLSAIIQDEDEEECQHT